MVVVRLWPKNARIGRGVSWGPSALRPAWLRALVPGLAATVLAASVSFVTAGTAAAATYNPGTDPYSMAAVDSYIGATTWWNQGYTGKGIDVALIDTGVSPVPALSRPGQVVNGPDLSIDGQNPALTYLDSNGHGTFMAGLIAGHEPTLTAPYASAPASEYRGVAPDARIINVKVGDTDGGVDVSQVIAAIDWVVQNARDPGFNIRIISLSYGTNSTQAYTVDPLAYAVEQAWKHGIVVVAAAGNTGFQIGANAQGLADPAYDPYDIAVGSYDCMGSATIADDVVAPYSAGVIKLTWPLPKEANFLAPGSHIQGLRDPGSYIDVNNPSAELGSEYFRGSGTSEAAAIAAGAIALILQKYPSLTPDEVKHFITSYASPIPRANPIVEGAGEINLNTLANETPAGYTQDPWSSTGSGSLELSRGTDHLTLDGVELTGEQDIFGSPFDASAMATLEAAGDSWSGGEWNGDTWTGNSWAGNNWPGVTWAGNSWAGKPWAGNTWTGNSWTGNSWTGNSWTGNSWTGNSWTGNDWMNASWS
jgi:serine protease AprX